MTELKPCPFCGGCGHIYEDGRLSIKPYNFPKWYITCKKCGVKTPTAKIEQVVRIWNRRVNDDAMDMAIEALKCSETPKSSERTVETIQSNHTAESDIKVSISCAHENDLISRKAAIADAVHMELFGRDYPVVPVEVLNSLPSAQPDRKLIDDYMWKIKQNISPHTAAEGVIAIKYYLEQIYEQIYGEGEKPKWMT